MNGKCLWVLGALLAVLSGCLVSAPEKTAVEGLRVEMKENPVGIDVTQPRFSWRLASGKQKLSQEAYRLQVAASPEALRTGKELLWDSGVDSTYLSVLIPYAGEKLESGKTYYWRVHVKTNQGDDLWSDVGSWTMALLDESEWEAAWIGQKGLTNSGETDQGETRLAARYLRKEFQVDKPVKRAFLYISGLGCSEAYLNGQPVAGDVLSPTPSLYTKRIYYNVYDVTELLQPERNAIGVVVGNGRYFAMRIPGIVSFGLPRLLAQLQIEYADGSESKVVSDASWKVTSQGPIVANNEFDGEEYDARLELGAWNKEGYDDSRWQAADLMEAPGGKLVAQPNPNICIQERIKPVSITKRPDGKYILDMGQNMVGWLAVNLKGKKERPVTMKFAELLQPDGSLYLANLRSAKVTDVYTPAQDGAFSWSPRFVYHGFRFVEVDGLDYEPALTDFTGEVIYDKMETTGTFETSDSLLNRLFRNAYWGIRGNYRGMPTDCPQRDERMGWLGDRATGASGEAYLLDNALLYGKWLQDIEDSQSPEGSISDVSPYYWTLYNDDVTWPSAFFNIADMLYGTYGDDTAIRKYYPAMKRWIERMQKTAMQDYIIVKDTYGDWCMPPESPELIHSQDPARKTDGALLSTAVFCDLLMKMSNFSYVMMWDLDAVDNYAEQAARVKKAYNDKFFHPETAQYGNNTVTANLLSLRFGLVPEGYEDKVFANIVKKTEEDFDGHVSTGVVGIQYLMRELTKRGRGDLAYKIATNDTYPSWGYMIKNGATTIWELWNGNTADPAMNSANHVMLLGDLLIWYYESLAGIKCMDGVSRFGSLEMKPLFPEGLERVSATYKSVNGVIRSAWTVKEGKLSWDITVPPNTTATISIPIRFHPGRDKQPGMDYVSEEGGYVQFGVWSGTYHFESK